MINGYCFSIRVANLGIRGARRGGLRGQPRNHLHAPSPRRRQRATRGFNGLVDAPDRAPDRDPDRDSAADPRVAAYLARLGRPDLRGAPADRATLVALHRAHVERVPYETLQIALGRPPAVDADSSVASVLRGQGGYCFHLNGAFAWLLSRLGYAVQHHRAGVQGARAAEPVGADGNHLALTVDLAGQPWLVDVGLGSALHDPVPLVPGRYRQGPFDYGVRPSDVVPGGWRFDHDLSADSFAGMDWEARGCTLAEATTRHTELSTSPDSMFVTVLAVQRRDAHGVDLLRSVSLMRIDAAGRRERVLESPADFEGVLRGVFGLDLTGMPDEQLAAVWRQQADRYAAYQAKKTARA